MKLSIVTTLYCSASYVEEFHRRASDTARETAGDDYEIIMVNDGSPDDSLEKAVALTHTDSHLLVVDLSRNFGHHRAIMAGLEHSRGDRVFLLDVDLEEDPEWLAPFSREMDSLDCDVVYGVQHARRGGWFERWSGILYYRLISWLTDLQYHANQVTARLMTRRFVTALTQYQERSIVFTFLCGLTGFQQHPFYVKKHSSSPTSYTLKKKLDIVVNAVTSFSDKPLRIFFNIGILISTLSLFYIIYLILAKLYYRISISGYSSIMVSLWLIGGIIISQIGVLSMYLAKVFVETKMRPTYTVRALISNHPPPSQ